ncbi:MAG: hypothetical protein SFU25_04090 [Candidatus Caenarcaniphilales bacterium]|nr:hypothetical protein [Candidatus Caenarcaniphilales bacterium]
MKPISIRKIQSYLSSKLPNYSLLAQLQAKDKVSDTRKPIKKLFTTKGFPTIVAGASTIPFILAMHFNSNLYPTLALVPTSRALALRKQEQEMVKPRTSGDKNTREMYQWAAEVRQEFDLLNPLEKFQHTLSNLSYKGLGYRKKGYLFIDPSDNDNLVNCLQQKRSESLFYVEVVPTDFNGKSETDFYKQYRNYFIEKLKNRKIFFVSKEVFDKCPTLIAWFKEIMEERRQSLILITDALPESFQNIYGDRSFIAKYNLDGRVTNIRNYSRTRSKKGI